MSVVERRKSVRKGFDFDELFDDSLFADDEVLESPLEYLAPPAIDDPIEIRPWKIPAFIKRGWYESVLQDGSVEIRIVEHHRRENVRKTIVRRFSPETTEEIVWAYLEQTDYVGFNKFSVISIMKQAAERAQEIINEITESYQYESIFPAVHAGTNKMKEYFHLKVFLSVMTNCVKYDAPTCQFGDIIPR